MENPQRYHFQSCDLEPDVKSETDPSFKIHFKKFQNFSFSMLKLFEGVETAPLRSLDEFLLAKSRYQDIIWLQSFNKLYRFETPNFNNPEKWFNRIVNNLLYYQVQCMEWEYLIILRYFFSDKLFPVFPHYLRCHDIHKSSRNIPWHFNYELEYQDNHILLFLYLSFQFSEPCTLPHRSCLV